MPHLLRIAIFNVISDDQVINYSIRCANRLTMLVLASDLLTFKDTIEDGASLNWSIETPPDKATKFIHDDSMGPPPVPLTERDLEIVVIQPGFRIVLPIDIRRTLGPPYEQDHVFDTSLTLREFLGFLYKFYNTELLLMEYPWAKKFASK